MYMWGGRDASLRYIPATDIEVFTDGRWVKMTTKGTPPAGVYLGGCTAIGRIHN